MKKNMLAIVILAATIVNVALTALMLFTVIPKAQRTDALIQKICAIIDMELENPDAADYADIPATDREVYTLADKVTVNLPKVEGASKSPYAQVEISLILNKKAEDYETVQPLISKFEQIIKTYVSEEVAKYTVDTIRESKGVIQEVVLAKLRAELGSSDTLIGVSLYIISDSR